MDSFFTSDTGMPSPDFGRGNFDFKSKSGLMFSADTLDRLKESGANLSDTTLERLRNEGFWELLIQSVSEQHSDGFMMAEVMSDTFTAQTMGANPVKINVSAQLWMHRKEDHRLDFLTLYNTFLRGSKAQENKVAVLFFYTGTIMRIFLENISITSSASTQDTVSLNFAGTGVYYRNQYSGVIEETTEQDTYGR